MQTNTNKQSSAKNIIWPCGESPRCATSRCDLKFDPRIPTWRTASLLVFIVAFLWLHLERAEAYQIVSTYGGGVISKGHWDSLEKKYDPLTQQIQGPWKFGNSQDSFNVAEFKVIPQPGDAQTGQVLLTVGYMAKETLRQELENFTAAPFDYHYAFNYRTAPNFDLRLPGPDHPLAATQGGTGFFLLDATIGVPFSLEFRFGGNVHEGYNAGDWSPEVIDPSIPGRAYMQITGTMKLVSMAVVPEPTAAAMTLLGASILGMTLHRSRAR